MLYEFSVTIPCAKAEKMTQMLIASGFYHLYHEQPIEVYSYHNGYGFTECRSGSALLKIYEETAVPDQVQARLAGLLHMPVDCQLVPEQSWQQPFPVIDLGNGWRIQPPDCGEAPHEQTILFEPPRAFGSGLHGTTQDCLRVILAEDFTGKRVLDLGTGAGLLSIAAALRGAGRIVAVDIEDVRAEVLYNAGLNKLSRIEVLQGDVLDPVFRLHEAFDWIFANIGGDEVKSLCPFILSHLKQGGRVLLSGMVTWNYKDVVRRYAMGGLKQQLLARSEEWITVQMHTG
ncbi:50S ribosomal protein L11 methyltransferase [Ectobacillus ponti]|uniref:50S ribosomal protein L11 methyltransferase n=1 Tax=Ectobacillus ponti TaxID=2961894 RepID=A0AA42BQ64_9BACI|nr:50S ribosomal protein L11 methyltransferase [Ectobacillus ponti]MCP8969537.1 50S ribosomal protein L11 methyltransferase [Ectobacillus ponti]